VPLDYLDPQVCIKYERHRDNRLVFCDREGKRLDKLPRSMAEDSRPEDFVEARKLLDELLRGRHS
jgi:hypothetical protein